MVGVFKEFPPRARAQRALATNPAELRWYHAPRRRPSATALCVNTASFRARMITCPNLHLVHLLGRADCMKHQHPTPIHRFSGFFLADRTRSGFSGLLGSFWALLGPPPSFGESPKAPDFAGESSTFPVSESEFRGRFNSPRLHHKP
jgi:hypothetical protein